eukprot:1144812-Pelagomonas_calceolata.AAC.3
MVSVLQHACATLTCVTPVLQRMREKAKPYMYVLMHQGRSPWSKYTDLEGGTRFGCMPSDDISSSEGEGALDAQDSSSNASYCLQSYGLPRVPHPRSL